MSCGTNPSKMSKLLVPPWDKNLTFYLFFIYFHFTPMIHDLFHNSFSTCVIRFFNDSVVLNKKIDDFFHSNCYDSRFIIPLPSKKFLISSKYFNCTCVPVRVRWY